MIAEGPTHSGQEPRPLTQSHPKLWMGRTGWAFRKPGPCLRLWHVAHPALLAPASLALSGELVHARGVNHVPWQPSWLRNRKEFKEKLPRYKSHPGPQRHLLPCGLGGNEPQRRFLAAYTPVCVCTSLLLQKR